MTHRISVDFAGLCVFATKDAPEKLNVLLGADPQAKMRHRPILSFNVRNFGTFSGKKIDQVVQTPDGSQIASWHLDKKIVRFGKTPGARPANVVLVGHGAPRTRCPDNPASEMGLCWVPSLQKVCGVGEVDPVYLSDNPASKGHAALGARVELAAGNLFANATVNRQAPFEYWTFDDGTRKHSQYMADTVRLELETAPDAPLVITANKFGTDVTETLTLEPWNGKIEVTISNLPDVLGHEHGSDAAKKMEHFDFYYELLGKKPQHRPIPTTDGDSTCGVRPAAAKPPSGGMAPMGTMTVNAYGIQPVKCTPGMVP